MSKNWIWIGKYIVVIVAALILGVVLGNLQLFKGATLGAPKLTAGSLSQFIAQGGALVMLWLMGQRISRQLGEMGGNIAKLSKMVLALVTLVVAAFAYAVLLQFAAPLLSRTIKPLVDWTFILGILAAAVWLILALYTDAESLIQALASRKKQSNA